MLTHMKKLTKTQLEKFLTISEIYLLIRWKDHEYIISKYKYLNINDYFLSDILPKIHGIVPSELLSFR